MGSTFSTGVSDVVEGKIKTMEATLQAKMHKQAMLQREIQMAVNIAKARDSLMWYGSLYCCYVVALSTAIITKKPLPAIAPMPGVLGGFGLLNLYDVAYGGKLIRVAKEAEYIMDNERSRFVPMKQAPFYGLYTPVERSHPPYSTSAAVGTYWPSFLPLSRPPIDK